MDELTDPRLEHMEIPKHLLQHEVYCTLGGYMVRRSSRVPQEKFFQPTAFKYEVFLLSLSTYVAETVSSSNRDNQKAGHLHLHILGVIAHCSIVSDDVSFKASSNKPVALACVKDYESREHQTSVVQCQHHSPIHLAGENVKVLSGNPGMTQPETDQYCH